MFSQLCGVHAAKRVRLVTTMWDDVADTNTAEKRVTELEGTFWKPLIDAGARHLRFRNTPESAWNIIRDAIGDSEVLLIQEELVDAKRRLDETTMGKPPCSRFQGLVQEQIDSIKQLSDEASTQQDLVLAEKCEAEDRRIEAQLQETWELEETVKLKVLQWLKLFLRRSALSKKKTRPVSILCWMYWMESHVDPLP